METALLLLALFAKLLPIVLVGGIIIGLGWAVASAVDSFERMANAAERIAQATEDGVYSDDDDDDDDDVEDDITDPPPGGDEKNISRLEDVVVPSSNRGRIPFHSNLQN